MKETNTTTEITEKIQGESVAKDNETKSEKFIRISEYRTNKAVDAIGRLLTVELMNIRRKVDAMFLALENRIAEVKAKFAPKKGTESKAFSFGTTE